MAKEHKPEAMTEEELAAVNGEPLPDRQAMSVIREPFPEPVLDYPGGYTIDPPQPDDV